jgi:DNA (cytosine-5)-methyltransferase 1
MSNGGRRRTGALNVPRLKAIDLFCGCGGVTVGLKKAGFQVLAAVDLDPLSIATYKANHSKVTTWEGDIRTLNAQSVRRRLGLRKGELDLIAGCPPCQGFSTMRTLNGAMTVEDDRNELLLDLQRFIEEFVPRAIMMENVPGLAHYPRFQQFKQRMEDLGYRGDHRVLDAVGYGVPQRRRRLIYLASLGTPIPFWEGNGSHKTVRDAIAKLPKPGKTGDAVHDLPENRGQKVKDLIRRIPRNGGSRTDLPAEDQLSCHQKCDGFKDVYGRMAWDEPAPTITSGCFNPSKGRFLHPSQNRAITMREAALLQGFPRRYHFPTQAGKCAIALMIGNALPPPFIAAHARAIRMVIQTAGSPKGKDKNGNRHR